jgi:hypothetical protein
MKRLLIILLLTISALETNAQIQEAQQLILNIKKLDYLREILDNMYKGYKILTKGYNTIRDISQGSYTIHQAFIDGLMAVNPTIRAYKKIPFIIDYQKLLIAEYKRYYNKFKKDPGFKPDELEYMAGVYNFLIDASLRNIDDLMMIITATKLRMTDDERMRGIDRIYDDMENKMAFLRYFNNSTQLLAMQRAKQRQDVITMRKLYGVE